MRSMQSCGRARGEEAGQGEDHGQDDRQECQQTGHRQQVGVLRLLLLSQVLRLRLLHQRQHLHKATERDHWIFAPILMTRTVQARRTASIIMRVS